MGLFPIARCLVGFYYYYVCIEIPVSNANSIDADQIPHSAVSDLGPHCLPVTLFGVSRLEWVEGMDIFSEEEIL